MAMPGLQGNRKFKRLARLLDSIAYGETQVRGFGQSIAMGSLELLWESCYANLDDVLGTPDDVESAATWNGAPGALFEALRDAGKPWDQVGFIEECPDRPGIWRVHDLWDHAPEYVARQMRRKVLREENGETLSRLRAEAGRKGGRSKASKRQANGKQTADTCQSGPLANVATTDPIRSDPPRLAVARKSGIGGYPTKADMLRAKYPGAAKLHDLLVAHWDGIGWTWNEDHLARLEGAVRERTAERLADACVEFVRDGETPGSLALFATVLERLPDPKPRRKGDECPKPGDVDFNDPDAWPTFEQFTKRDAGRAHA